MTAAITITTIHVPECLADYCRNLDRHGHRDVAFVVVGDLRTPAEAAACCDRVAAEFGRSVTYLDPEAQRRYLARFPALSTALPWNSFARRNVGDLWALEQGAEVIVRIDDDNYPTDGDFLGPHLDCGRTVDAPSVGSATGWFNVCELLEERRGIPFYPRGFPYSRRWKGGAVETSRSTARIAVNAGLWLGDPDVDALTRLTYPIEAVAAPALDASGVTLAPGTWCPINTQNTSFHRDALVAAYVPPDVGRYDDIWMGYVLRRIVDQMGDRVRYGWPLVHQQRNVHNLWRDLDAEMNGNLYTDLLVECLRELPLTASTYLDCYAEALEGLSRGLTERRELFAPLLDGGRAWLSAVEVLEGRCAS